MTLADSLLLFAALTRDYWTCPGAASRSLTRSGVALRSLRGEKRTRAKLEAKLRGPWCRFDKLKAPSRSRGIGGKPKLAKVKT
jgi:hypothetical protein